MSTQKEDTRTRLFEAARRLLVKGGFHHVKLEDIAEAAGVSRQAVYKSHFASKAELLLELVRYVHVAENLDEFTRPYFAAETGPDMLREAIRAVVLIEGRVHDLALALSAAALSDAGAAAAVDDRLAVKRGAVRGALERVKAEGRLSPDWQMEEAVDVVAALLSVDTYEQLVGQRAWQPEQLIQRIGELTQTLLLEPSEPRPRSTKKKAGRRRSAA
jgi:AcrR family transcriptional regulator